MHAAVNHCAVPAVSAAFALCTERRVTTALWMKYRKCDWAIMGDRLCNLWVVSERLSWLRLVVRSFVKSINQSIVLASVCASTESLWFQRKFCQPSPIGPHNKKLKSRVDRSTVLENLKSENQGKTATTTDSRRRRQSPLQQLVE